jgi:hypothetical protein
MRISPRFEGSAWQSLLHADSVQRNRLSKPWTFRTHGRRHRPGTTIAATQSVRGSVKRQVARMIGEFLREASVLITVFAPLELFLASGTLTIRATVGIVVVVVSCQLLGMSLELER